MKDKQVHIYSKVTIKNNNKNNGYQDFFILVPPEEINLSQKKISMVSPIGKSLLNKKVDDIVEVQVPSGILKYKIVKIE